MGVAIIVPDVSFADANLGKVNITGDVPVQALRIVAEDSYTGRIAQLRVSYLPLATTQRNVVWSIVSGSSYASISQSGILAINENAMNSNITVKVESASDPSIFNTKMISVTYNSGSIPNKSYELKNHVVNATVDTGIDLFDNEHKSWTFYMEVSGQFGSGRSLLLARSRNATGALIGFNVFCESGIPVMYAGNGTSWVSRKSYTFPFNKQKFIFRRDNDKLYTSDDNKTWTLLSDVVNVNRDRTLTIGGSVASDSIAIGATIDKAVLYDGQLTPEQAIQFA